MFKNANFGAVELCVFICLLEQMKPVRTPCFVTVFAEASVAAVFHSSELGIWHSGKMQCKN